MKLLCICSAALYQNIVLSKAICVLRHFFGNIGQLAKTGLPFKKCLVQNIFVNVVVHCQIINNCTIPLAVDPVCIKIIIMTIQDRNYSLVRLVIICWNVNRTTCVRKPHIGCATQNNLHFFRFGRTGIFLVFVNSEPRFCSLAVISNFTKGTRILSRSNRFSGTTGTLIEDTTE